MSAVVLLDAGPLGLITNPRGARDALECNQWMEMLLANGVQVVIPEIADYEIRRELLRANKTKGLERLNGVKEVIEYIPITTPAMLKAAEFWAQARQQGRPTAADKSLDADVILAAQAFTLEDREEDVVIATTNVAHLEQFFVAKHWRDIDYPAPSQV